MRRGGETAGSAAPSTGPTPLPMAAEGVAAVANPETGLPMAPGGSPRGLLPMADAVTVAVHGSLQDVPDPCMVAAGAPASILELGLVDSVVVEGGTAKVALTLTEPGCPFTHHIIAGIHDAALAIDGVDDVEVTPVWAPLWTEERLEPEGRKALMDARKRMRG